MGFIMGKDRMGNGFASPELPGDISPPAAVFLHITVNDLDIDIMEKAGYSPLLLIPAEAQG
jgi:hypothetical protein